MEFLAECPNGKNSDSVFFKIPISFVDLVEFRYFRPLNKIIEGGFYVPFRRNTTLLMSKVDCI